MYNPKSRRTKKQIGAVKKKTLDGLTANKNIDDIIALSKISNTQTTEIKNVNSGLSKLSASVSSKQNKLTLTTTGSSGPATLNNDTLNIPDYSVAASGYVPYIGATGDVDLGEHEIKAGQVEFDQTPTGTAGVAVMRWNDQDGTVDLGLKGGNVTLQVGQEQVTRVVNKTGINLLEANYQVVRVDGAQGNRLKVALAQANNDANSAETLGIVTETINDNQEGFVTTSGLVRGINTTGSIQGETWSDGDMLYLSGTVAGLLTNIKPAAPIHTVIMGYVVRAHATQGQIYVKVDNGYELDELHNVAITSPSNGQTLVYDSATSLWKNGSGGGGGGASPIDIQLFTSSGVWTKPAGAKQVEVYLFGAGGGGGSGRVGAAASARYGGGGASTGSVYINKLDASVFNNTENIWIGAGGTGGSAQTVANSNGNNGVTGGSSFVGGTGGAGSAKIIAPGGAPGQGGRDTSNGSGQAPGGVIYGVYGTSNYGSQTVNSNGFTTVSTFTMRPLTPGVFGGGIDTANGRYSGSTIVNRYMDFNNIYSILGGTSAGASGNNGISSFTNPHFIIMASGGSGGASGDVAGTVSGGRGGDGEICCGGGGGGAATNGASSGAGGNGGNGYCIMITYF